MSGALCEACNPRHATIRTPAYILPLMIAVRPPEYWPRIEYMALLDRVEAFVIADTFQYSRQSFQNRGLLRTPDGRQWISIPLRGHQHGRPICEVEIHGRHRWLRKHWRALHYNYRTTPFFGFYEDLLRPIFEEEWHRLSDLTTRSLELVSELLGIDTVLVRASELGGPAFDRASTQRGASRRNGAPQLVVPSELHEPPTPSSPPTRSSPPATAKPPATMEAILDVLGRSDLLVPRACASIDLQPASRVLMFEERERRQNFAGFIPGVSALDLLFNYGPEALGMIRRQVRLVDSSARSRE